MRVTPAISKQIAGLESLAPPETPAAEVAARNFERIVSCYLENGIPRAELFRGLGVEERVRIAHLTGRSHLWTREAVEECADLLQLVIERTTSRRGRPPIIVEVAGGCCDLSFGLARLLPELRIIPTDAFPPEERGGRNIYKLFAEEFTSGTFRQKLAIPEEDSGELIILASHLPRDAGVECELLSQKNVHELLIVQCFTGRIQTSGDSTVLSNPEVWRGTYSLPNQKLWLDGYGEFENGWKRGNTLEIQQYSRISGQVPHSDAVGVRSIHEMSPSWDISSAEGMVDGFRSQFRSKWREEVSPGWYWPHFLRYVLSDNQVHEIRQRCELAVSLAEYSGDGDQAYAWEHAWSNLERRIMRGPAR